MNWLGLYRRVRCALGKHDWKRAVRIAATLVGAQRCKHCGARRQVTLRGKQAPKAPSYVEL